MKVERPNDRPLSPEEMAHLETLKSVVEKALDDGKFSPDELSHIKSLIWTDSKELTYAELRTINDTIKSVMGNESPDLEWMSLPR